jgi:hypothetical protein
MPSKENQAYEGEGNRTNTLREPMDTLDERVTAAFSDEDEDESLRCTAGTVVAINESVKSLAWATKKRAMSCMGNQKSGI